MKRLIAALLAFALCMGLLPARAAQARFSDVPADAWYAGAVEFISAHDLMQGHGDGRFAPEDTMTQAESLVLAARVYALTQDSAGTLPQSNIWYEGAVRYLYDKDVLPLLESDHFPASADAALADLTAPLWSFEDAPENMPPIADMAQSRFFAAALLSAAVPDERLTAVNRITDLPDYRETAWDFDKTLCDLVLRLYNAGVMTGTDKWGSVGGELTRAEAATILARILEPTMRVRFTPAEMPFEITTYPGDVHRLGSTYRNGRLLVGMSTSGNDALWGYMDKDLQMVIPAKYEEAQDFQNGLAEVTENGTSKLIDTMGRTVLTYSVNTKPTVTHGFIVHRKSAEGHALLDSMGKVVIPYGNSSILVLTDKLAIVERFGTYALYCTDGTALTGFDFISFGGWSDGRIALCTPEWLWGYWDESGKNVIPPLYQTAQLFTDGVAAVSLPAGSCIASEYFLIDKRGERVPAPFAELRASLSEKYDEVGAFESGLASVRNAAGLCGMVDTQGREVLPCAYAMAYRDAGANYLKAETTEGKLLFYSLSGEPLTQADLYRISYLESYPEPPFSEGYAPRVQIKRDVTVFGDINYYPIYAYFNEAGEQVTPYLFSQAGGFADGIAVADRGDTEAYVLRIKK